MRILVTGGAGFIGSNLCIKYLEAGDEVWAIDNFITGQIDSIHSLSSSPKFKFVRHDIVKTLPRNIRLFDIDQIYHLACPTGVSNLTTYGEEMLLTCSLGTKNVLELAREKQAKLLFTSSSEVYGDAKVFPQSEDYTGNVDPIGVRSPYEEGKRFSESLITMYTKKYNMDTRIVRIFNTYGPGMSVFDTRVIPQFLYRAINGKPLVITGKGVQKRTFLYIDDLIEGLILLMEEGRKGQVYNLGSDVELSIVELAQLVLRLTGGRSKVGFIKRPSHDPQMRLPSLVRIKRLGWYPKTPLRKGLKKTIASLKENQIEKRKPVVKLIESKETKWLQSQSL